ncbi:conserved hypothetical protein [Hyella patelloides LEGE 07179]|uniref:vWA-MoxR associated protein N-terminal HTH domain-containing protein n=1 Tax=Hyella patelloides LEGE 07179 TaxID=945734 RepID=A0A563VUL9_9CYAN|nr:AAA-like domain-containing protein [Hyella patelloides]VEP15084.1 conserved hypothetical protein [Hyella patelloides LEGE 07179]
MKTEEALSFVEELIQPEKLSTLQEIVFRECWQGKTYLQIARHSDYDANYIRGVGSRLWQLLSQICQEEVTKNNLRSVLRQQSSKKISDDISLELPDGIVPTNSYFYIERHPLESDCCEEIDRPGALLRIKAPQKMGKTSLLNRIMAEVKPDYYQVKIDLQQADSNIICNTGRLIRWLIANICSQLAMKNLIDSCWDEDLGLKVSCSNYLENYVLCQLDKPLILAIDRLEIIFKHREVAQEFIPLLLFWHEEAQVVSHWQKLRLIVVQSTESYVPLVDFKQSSFNVGLSMNLPTFDREQMLDLASRHQLIQQNDFQKNGIAVLSNLIGGHPYLARLAFYHLAKYHLNLNTLIEEAATETSIFIDTLRHYLKTLYDHTVLAEAFSKVVKSDSPVQLDSLVNYQLENLGLISLKGNEVVPSCQLYRLYFRDRLH